jgi:hypothetical protein
MTKSVPEKWEAANSMNKTNLTQSIIDELNEQACKEKAQHHLLPRCILFVAASSTTRSKFPKYCCIIITT